MLDGGLRNIFRPTAPLTWTLPRCRICDKAANTALDKNTHPYDLNE
jgi:hypothetical protein